MKTAPFSRLLLTAFLLTGSLLTASAQTEKKNDAPDKNRVTIKIIERTDAGDVREINRSYRSDGLRDDERDALVNRLVDSLRAKRGDRKGQVTVIIDDTRETPGDRVRPRGYARRPGEPAEFHYYRDGRSPRTDSLAGRARRFDFTFPENWSQRMNDAFRDWNIELGDAPKASTIRSLQVYPNNPEQHELNVRFSAPAKGDVRIRVTTPDGKEVARKEVNGFSGSYSGQIDLGKKAKGVFFVTVTQNEDGATKRVVVGE